MGDQRQRLRRHGRHDHRRVARVQVAEGLAKLGGWLGIVAGILSIASIVFFPQFLYLLWVLIVSIVMFLRPARYGAGAT